MASDAGQGRVSGFERTTGGLAGLAAGLNGRA